MGDQIAPLYPQVQGNKWEHLFSLQQTMVDKQANTRTCFKRSAIISWLGYGSILNIYTVINLIKNTYYNIFFWIIIVCPWNFQRKQRLYRFFKKIMLKIANSLTLPIQDPNLFLKFFHFSPNVWHSFWRELYLFDIFLSLIQSHTV